MHSHRRHAPFRLRNRASISTVRRQAAETIRCTMPVRFICRSRRRCCRQRRRKSVRAILFWTSVRRRAENPRRLPQKSVLPDCSFPTNLFRHGPKSCCPTSSGSASRMQSSPTQTRCILPTGIQAALTACLWTHHAPARVCSAKTQLPSTNGQRKRSSAAHSAPMRFFLRQNRVCAPVVR